MEVQEPRDRRAEIEEKRNILTVREPSFEVLTPDGWTSGMIPLIEAAGRRCYKSEHKIGPGTADRFVERFCTGLGHTSMIEHAFATVVWTGSRAMSHQLVRHRLAAYCLSGDTEVIGFQKVKGYYARRWTLKQLADWQDNPKRKGRLKLIRLRSIDGLGRIVRGKIKKLIRSGVQTVYEVVTRCGRSIKATAKHRFLTASGWKRLSDLKPGDTLLANGLPALKNAEWLEHMYLEKNMARPELAGLVGVSDSTLGKVLKGFGIRKPYNQRPNRAAGHGVPGMHGVQGRQAISERMQGEGNHRWKGSEAGQQAGRLRAQRMYIALKCESCDTTEGDIHRHHPDRNPLNNAPSNILILCETCHKAHDVARGGCAVMTVIKTPIVSIKEIGLEETFDIEMEGPHHNFVADGLVVHNSQESQRYCDYGKKGFQVVAPPAAKIKPGTWRYDHEGKIWSHEDGIAFYGVTTQERLRCQWLMDCRDEYTKYLWWRIMAGFKAEDARFHLPNGTKTEVAATYDFHVWRHIFEHRGLNPRAQWEIRGIAQQILRVFAEKWPAVFGDLLEAIPACNEQVRKVEENYAEERAEREKALTPEDFRL